MRIGDLSRRTGIPVPTIKYYLREELLPYGERTGPNQVRYDESHVHRLGLIRALLDVGRLPVAVAREVLGAIASDEGSLFKKMGVVHYAITRAHGPTAPDEEARTREIAAVDALIERRGWQVKDGNPSRAQLAELLGTLAKLGHADIVDRIDDYAARAGELAAIDVDLIDRTRSAEDVLETLAVTMVIGDALVSTLGRLAHEHLTSPTGLRP